MNKEELQKRQEELKELFIQATRERASLAEQVSDAEARVNQYSGAFQEVTRQISELEKKEEKPNEN